VRCTGPELEVLREGILARADVLHTAAAHVLFVCTGNTCRSPMAEVLARDAVARALDVAPGRLLARGLSFASAGTGTLDGMQASEGSVIALQERGLDLHDHRSRALTRELCARATRIFCMSGSHRDAVLDLAPDAAAKTALLRPDGGNIADPYGGELPDYRSARDEITAAIGERLRELLALLPAK
jgi:protein-tyrosine phosphatase